MWVPLAVGLLMAGCVRRELQVMTRPPGATVTFDGQILERKTPLFMSFTWYGTHEIIVEKPGYHRERLVAHLKPPWYERFPIDLFSDLLVPWRIDDIHPGQGEPAPGAQRRGEDGHQGRPARARRALPRHRPRPCRRPTPAPTRA